jgi:Kazal-type serine protease inhibitor domain
MKHPGAWLSLLLPATIGCAVEEIPFATDRGVEPSADAAVDSERGCSASEPCEPGEYCALRGCNGTQGTCRQTTPEASCGSELAPVCGCDGVTYFNDCLREASQVGSATSGPCLRERRLCGVSGAEPCPTGLFCAKLFPVAAGVGFFPPSACLPQLPGVCWMLPDSCDAEPGDDVWVSCEDGASARCADTCSAIRSERLHIPTSMCAS